MARALLILVCLVVGTLARPLEDPLQCASSCSGSSNLYNYEVGKAYVYEFSSKNKANVPNMTEDSVTLSVTGSARIEVISQCEFLIKLEGVTLDESYTKGADGKSESKQFKVFKDMMEAQPMRFGMDNGRVTDVCPEKTENQFAMNFKRSILSQIHNTMESLDSPAYVTETDVTGECITEYTPKKMGNKVKIQKRKAIQGCTKKHMYYSDVQGRSYEAPSELQKMKILDGSYNCDITIERKGVLQESVCKEGHIFRPYGTGPSIDIVQTLKLKSTEASKKIKTSPTSRSSLLFDHLKHSFDRYSTEKDDPLPILKQLCAETKGRYSEKVPTLFVSLIQRMRTQTFEQIDALHGKLTSKKAEICADNMDSVNSIFHDALPWVRSEAAVKFMAKEIAANHPKAKKQKALWTMTFAKIRHPTLAMIKATEPLLKKAETFESMVLVTAVMLKKYCAQNPDCGSKPEVVAAIKTIKAPLGTKCDSLSPAARRKLLFTLRAIGNMGALEESMKVYEFLVACMQNVKAESQIRVAAVDAFRNFPCVASGSQSNQLLPRLFEIFQHTGYEAELRIKAYLAMLPCLDDKYLNYILESKMQSQQVGSFVWSHLTNYGESIDPTKQELRNMVRKNVFQMRKLGKMYNLDFRSYSSYFEKSFYSEKGGYGGTTEGQVIYGEDSYIPKSACMNLTVEYFGRSVNVLEIDVRANRLEELFKEVTKPPTQVNVDKIKEKQNNIPKPKEQPHLALAARQYGNEIFYEPDINVMEIVGNVMMFQQQIYQPGFEKAMSGNMMVHESIIVVPTVSGLPLELQLESALSYKMNLNARMKWDDIKLKAEPSYAMRILGQMRINAHCTKVGLSAEFLSYTDRSVSMSQNIRILSPVTGAFKVKLTVDPVARKTQLFRLRSNVSVVRNSGTVPQKGIGKVNTDQYCTGDTMKKAVGLRYCLDYSYTTIEGQKLPMMAPASAGVSIDPRKGFNMEMEMNRDGTIPTKFRFAVGDEKEPETLLVDYGKGAKGSATTHTLKFKSPMGSYELAGLYNKGKIEASWKKGKEVKATLKGSYHPVVGNEHFLVTARLGTQKLAQVEYSNRTRRGSKVIHFEVKILKYIPFSMKTVNHYATAKMKGTQMRVEKTRHTIEVQLPNANKYTAEAIFALSQPRTASSKATVKLQWVQKERIKFKHQTELEYSQKKAYSKQDKTVEGIVYTVNIGQELGGIFDGKKKWAYKSSATTFLSTVYNPNDRMQPLQKLLKPIIIEHSATVKFPTRKRKDISLDALVLIDIKKSEKRTVIGDLAVVWPDKEINSKMTIKALYEMTGRKMLKSAEIQVYRKMSPDNIYEFYFNHNMPNDMTMTTTGRVQHPGSKYEVKSALMGGKTHTLSYNMNGFALTVNSDVKMSGQGVEFAHKILLNNKDYGTGTTKVTYALPQIELDHKSQTNKGKNLATITFKGDAIMAFGSSLPLDKDFSLGGVFSMEVMGLAKKITIDTRISKKVQKSMSYESWFFYMSEGGGVKKKYGYEVKETVSVQKKWTYSQYGGNMKIFAYGPPEKVLEIKANMSMKGEKGSSLEFKLTTPNKQLFEYSYDTERTENTIQRKERVLLDWKQRNNDVLYFYEKVTDKLSYQATGFTWTHIGEQKLSKASPMEPFDIKMSLNWSPIYVSAEFEFSYESMVFINYLKVKSFKQLINYKVSPKDGKVDINFMTNWKGKEEKATPFITLKITKTSARGWQKLDINSKLNYNVRNGPKEAELNLGYNKGPNPRLSATTNAKWNGKEVFNMLITRKSEYMLEIKISPYSYILKEFNMNAGLETLRPLSAKADISATVKGTKYEINSKVIGNKENNGITLIWSSSNVPYVASGQLKMKLLYLPAKILSVASQLEYQGQSFLNGVLHFDRTTNLTVKFQFRKTIDMYLAYQNKANMMHTVEGFVRVNKFNMAIPKSTFNIAMKKGEVEAKYDLFFNIFNMKQNSKGMLILSSNYVPKYFKHEESMNKIPLTTVLVDPLNKKFLFELKFKNFQKFYPTATGLETFKIEFVCDCTPKRPDVNDITATLTFDMAPIVGKISQKFIYFNGMKSKPATKSAVEGFGDANLRLAYILDSKNDMFKTFQIDVRLGQKGGNKMAGELIFAMDMAMYDIVIDKMKLKIEEVTISKGLQQMKGKLTGKDMSYDFEYNGQTNGPADFSYKLKVKGEHADNSFELTLKNMKFVLSAQYPTVVEMKVTAETDGTNSAAANVKFSLMEEERFTLFISAKHTGEPWSWKNWKHEIEGAFTPEDGKKIKFSYMEMMSTKQSARLGTSGIATEVTLKLDIPVPGFTTMKIEGKFDGVPNNFVSSLDIAKETQSLFKSTFDFSYKPNYLFKLTVDVVPAKFTGKLLASFDYKTAEFEISSITESVILKAFYDLKKGDTTAKFVIKDIFNEEVKTNIIGKLLYNPKLEPNAVYYIENGRRSVKFTLYNKQKHNLVVTWPNWRKPINFTLWLSFGDGMPMKYGGKVQMSTPFEVLDSLKFATYFYLKPTPNYGRLSGSFDYNSGTLARKLDITFSFMPVTIAFIYEGSVVINAKIIYTLGVDKYQHNINITMAETKQAIVTSTAECRFETFYACVDKCTIELKTPYRDMAFLRTCKVEKDRELSNFELYWNKRRNQGLAVELVRSIKNLDIFYDSNIKVKTPLRKVEFSSQITQMKLPRKRIFILKTSDHADTLAKTATFQCNTEFSVTGRNFNLLMNFKSSLLKKPMIIVLNGVRDGLQFSLDLSGKVDGANKPFFGFNFIGKDSPSAVRMNITAFLGSQSVTGSSYVLLTKREAVFMNDYNTAAKTNYHFTIKHKLFKLFRITNNKDMLVELVVKRTLSGMTSNTNITFEPEGLSLTKLTKWSQNPFNFYTKVKVPGQAVTMSARQTSSQSCVHEMYHEVGGETITDNSWILRVDSQNMFYETVYWRPQSIEYYKNFVANITKPDNLNKIVYVRTQRIAEVVIKFKNGFVQGLGSAVELKPIAAFVMKNVMDYETIPMSLSAAYQNDEFYMKTISESLSNCLSLPSISQWVAYQKMAMQKFGRGAYNFFSKCQIYDYMYNLGKSVSSYITYDNIKPCIKRIVDFVPVFRRTTRGIAQYLTDKADMLKAAIRRMASYDVKMGGAPKGNMFKFLEKLPEMLKDALAKVAESYSKTMGDDLKIFFKNLMSLREDTKQFRERYRTMMKWMRKYMMRRWAPNYQKSEAMKKLFSLNFVGAYDAYFQPSKFKMASNLDDARMELQMYMPFEMQSMLKRMRALQHYMPTRFILMMRLTRKYGFRSLFYRVSSYLKQKYSSVESVRRIALPPFKRSAWGVVDNYLITFNNVKLYVGCKTCKYLLATDTVAGSFALVAENGHDKNRKEFTFYDCDSLVIIKSNGKVLVGKVGKHHPKKASPPTTFNCLSITSDGQKVSVYSSATGIALEVYLKLGAFRLVVPGKLHGKVRGLLGRNDFDSADDIRDLKTGALLSDKGLINTWIMGKPQNIDEKTRMKYTLFCKETLQSNAFGACFFKVNREPYIKVCDSIPDWTATCNLFASYALRCSTNGISVSVPQQCERNLRAVQSLYVAT